MKTNYAAALIAFLTPVLLWTGSMFSVQEMPSELGTVQYSILDPAAFNDQNGAGWVLMDGRDISETDLCVRANVCSVPDARGVFIRGLNMNRAAAQGDPRGNSRQVGSYQDDAFEKHNHSITWNNHRSGMGTRNANGPKTQPGDRLQRNTSFAGEGTETRPKNIALYTYIKVNHSVSTTTAN